MELGEYDQAREAYSRALELDPYNTIAQKNLKRLAFLEEAPPSTKGDHRKIVPQLFIEDTGKVGVVDLYNPAPGEVLAKMASERIMVNGILMLSAASCDCVLCNCVLEISRCRSAIQAFLSSGRISNWMFHRVAHTFASSLLIPPSPSQMSVSGASKC